MGYCFEGSILVFRDFLGQYLHEIERAFRDFIFKVERYSALLASSLFLALYIAEY